ncbi:MAG: transposase [Candidatus Micrarchaeia archaeon]
MDKIHVAVDGKTHRILNIIVTEDYIKDVREFEPLIELLKEANTTGNVAADGAYDSEENFRYYDDNNIDVFISVRINSVGKRCKHRRKHVVEQLSIICKRGRNRNIILPKKIRRANQINWKN